MSDGFWNAVAVGAPAFITALAAWWHIAKKVNTVEVHTNSLVKKLEVQAEEKGVAKERAKHPPRDHK